MKVRMSSHQVTQNLHIQFSEAQVFENKQFLTSVAIEWE